MDERLEDTGQLASVSSDPEEHAAQEAMESADRKYAPIRDFADWARSAAVAEATWESYAERLRIARQGLEPPALDSAIRVAMRSAAVETGAIEGLYEADRGFTFTVATEAAAWEALSDEKGPEVRGHIEAQLEAYELLLDVATNRLPITLALIRRIHEVACANQRTYIAQTPSGPQQQALQHGAFKTNPNHVRLADGTVHAYAPVADTHPEMSKLVDQLTTNEFAVAHPVLQAAYAHHALVAIHPFADGNGRVARALASVYLYRALSLPFVVFADQKLLYYDALSAADEGNPNPLMDFVLERVLDTVGLVIEQLRAGKSHATERLAAFRDLLTSSGGLVHQELDSVATRLLNAAAESLTSAVLQLAVPPGVAINFGETTDNFILPPVGYRRFPQEHPVRLAILDSETPARAHVEVRYDVVISTDKSARDTFLLRTVGGTEMAVRLAEIHPMLSNALQMKLSSWGTALLAEGLDQLYDAATLSLRSVGY